MNFPGMTPSGAAAAPPAIGGPQDPNVKAVRGRATWSEFRGAHS
jgi:hypothetical protein